MISSELAAVKETNAGAAVWPLQRALDDRLKVAILRADGSAGGQQSSQFGYLIKASSRVGIKRVPLGGNPVKVVRM
jgi:hypothetical protein